MKKETERDIELFLKFARIKLERWTMLLSAGEITAEDFEWLVKSQRN